jgi:hypothetical protein
MRLSTLFLSAAALTFAAVAAMPASATGKVTCKAGPQSGWKTRTTLEDSLKKQGWTIRKSKVDGGCYEVYGTTPDGKKVEAYFHPVSLEKLYVSQRGKVLFRKEGY